MRTLIVNADDFGFARDVNRGIVEAHLHGILTATTLMATGAAFQDAVRLAKEHPSLDVGCHLVLVEPPFPATVSRLAAAVALGKIRPYEEFRAQVAKILDAGLRPTHLDTHKHTHLLPPVLEAVARVSREFRIPWVRRPFDFPYTSSAGWKKDAVSRSFGVVKGRFTRVFQKYGCRSTDHFAGFRITGAYDASALARLIAELPEGTTEFMCHPGVCSDELRGLRTRLKESRQQERDALLAPQVRQALERNAVTLANYRDLGAAS